MIDLSTVSEANLRQGIENVKNQPPAVYHMSQPKLPNWRFEYHPDTRKVYAIRIDQFPQKGELLIDHVPDHGTALNYVLVWMRGYLYGENPEEHTRGD